MPDKSPLVETLTPTITRADCDCLVIGLHADGELSGAAAEIDSACGGLLRRMIESSDLTGKECDLTPLWGLSGVQTGHVLVVGLGARNQLNRRTAFRTAAAASKQLASRSRETVAFYLAADWPADLVESAVAGAVVGCTGQDLYRKDKKRIPPARFAWATDQADALAQGAVIGEAVNLTRRLVNEPPQVLSPESFAEEARRACEPCGLQVEIWDEQRLEAERAGALLAVARGSARPPRLVIASHQGAGSSQPTLALVGKGVTFDSGGLSLKSSEGMKTMKCDMAGAATVLGAIQAVARLKLPVNVMAVAGLVENMPGGQAMKLGDVLHARNGKTIEVLNTDAEGRLVLADALDVAIERGATHLIDVATLTGACMVALGLDVAGLMSNDDTWCDQIEAAAETCGEACWQLPMFPEYTEQIQSEIADIKNIGKGRWGGAITAAKFLEEFVDGVPWTHVDIAGPAFLDSPTNWIDAGASGCFVRTLVEVARNYEG